MVRLEEPDADVTGAADVCNADTIVQFVQVAETAVPVSTVAINRSASAASIVLSAGTGNAAGVAIEELVVFAVPSRDTATVITAALAGVAIRVPIVMAATTARAIFLNEFIFLLVLFIVFILVYIPQGILEHRQEFP